MHSLVAETTTEPTRAVHIVDEHIVEIVSDSGEGAQTGGLILADLCAKNGNGIGTVEIIPAEIEPLSRSRAGIPSNRVDNARDAANLAVALDEQVLYNRRRWPNRVRFCSNP
jgi:2-oxoglutarate ferredoxin oxidoreductase subunit alpha